MEVAQEEEEEEEDRREEGGQGGGGGGGGGGRWRLRSLFLEEDKKQHNHRLVTRMKGYSTGTYSTGIAFEHRDNCINGKHKNVDMRTRRRCTCIPDSHAS